MRTRFSRLEQKVLTLHSVVYTFRGWFFSHPFWISNRRTRNRRISKVSFRHSIFLVRYSAVQKNKKCKLLLCPYKGCQKVYGFYYLLKGKVLFNSPTPPVAQSIVHKKDIIFKFVPHCSTPAFSSKAQIAPDTPGIIHWLKTVLILLLNIRFGLCRLILKTIRNSCRHQLSILKWIMLLLHRYW